MVIKQTEPESGIHFLMTMNPNLCNLSPFINTDRFHMSATTSRERERERERETKKKER